MLYNCDASNMNKKSGHFWSIILRFCRLEDRIQCGYINKFINEKYKLILPNTDDLFAVLNFLNDSKINRDFNIRLKPGLSYLDSVVSCGNFGFGLDYSSWLLSWDNFDVDHEMDIRREWIKDNSDESVLHGIIYVYDPSRWKILYICDDSENAYEFLLNIDEQNIHEHEAMHNWTKYICSFTSFVNNLPLLIKKRSKIIHMDNKITGEEILDRHPSIEDIWNSDDSDHS